MKERLTLLVSLSVNLALFGFLLYQVSLQPKPDQYRHELSVTNKVTELSVEVIRPPAPEAPAPFKWGDVESADYKIYIANLKGIGCPPATIRDIVLADLNDQFTSKRTALLASIQSHYWELEAAEGAQKAAEKALENVNSEKEALADLLVTLIGPIPEPPAKNDKQRFLGHVSDEKRQAVLAIEQKYEALIQGLSQEQNSLVVAQTKLKALDSQREGEIRQVLSPEEWDEYKLRRSPQAGWASNLYGFEPTSDEFRTVAKMEEELAKSQQRIRREDPDRRDKVAAQLKVKEEALRELLGDKRYADYQRASDNEYATMYKVAERYQLPANVSAQAYQVKQAAETQMALIAQQQTLSDEQRFAAIRTVQTETEKALKKSFGDDAFQTYLKYGGDWLKKLEQP